MTKQKNGVTHTNETGPRPRRRICSRIWRAAFPCAAATAAILPGPLHAQDAAASTAMDEAEKSINRTLDILDGKEDGWAVVTTDADNTSWSVRRGDLSKGRPRVWVKQDHSRDRTTPVRRTMLLYRVDCDGRSIGIEKAVEYFPNGKNNTFAPDQVDMGEVDPDSVAAKFLEAVCPAAG